MQRRESCLFLLVVLSLGPVACADVEGKRPQEGEGCIAISAEDKTCDGVDDDCSGEADEDYVAADTPCGVGACGATGRRTCGGGTDYSATYTADTAVTP